MGITKITKATLKSKVRNLNLGEKLVFKMYPCKANTSSYWFSGIEMTITNEGEDVKELLEKLEKYINEFEYYMCSNVLGKYASYYLV